MNFVECFSLTYIERESLRPVNGSNFTFHAEIAKGLFNFWSDFVFKKEEEKEGFTLVLTFFYNITFQNVKCKKKVKRL